MKKLKLISPIMASVAFVTPCLAVLSSCSQKDYTEIVSEIKTLTIQKFKELSSIVHRNSWEETEIMEYLEKELKNTGAASLAGRDNWSDISIINQTIIKETGSAPVVNAYGNVWYDIPASKGMENIPGIIIQTHLDTPMKIKNDTHAGWEAWREQKNNLINVTVDNENDLLFTGPKDGVNGDTSLGADGGIAIALMIALAQNRQNFTHGPIRLLFTAGEQETGAEKDVHDLASGAALLYYDQWGYLERSDAQSFEGPGYYYKNLQGNLEKCVSIPLDQYKKPFGENGEFNRIISLTGLYKNTVYKSSAGIHECDVEKIASADDGIKPTPIGDGNLKQYTVTIDGTKLQGGASSKDINNNYANAVQMLMSFLLTSDSNMRLINIKSDESSYSIPKNASCTFATSLDYNTLCEKASLFFEYFKATATDEDWADKKWDDIFIVKQINENLYQYGLSPEQSSRITILTGECLKYGSLDWFDIYTKKNVKTSANFTGLKLEHNEDKEDSYYTFKLKVIHRSAEEKQLILAQDLSHALMEQFLYDMLIENPTGGQAHDFDKYITHINTPVWERNDNDSMVKLVKDSYKYFKYKNSELDTHGWVEPGCFPNIFNEDDGKAAGHISHPKLGDGLNVTCVGPLITNNHELNEVCDIDSVKSMIATLLYCFDNIK